MPESAPLSTRHWAGSSTSSLLRRASRSWLLRKALLLPPWFHWKKIWLPWPAFGHVDGGVGLLHQDQVILAISLNRLIPTEALLVTV